MELFTSLSRLYGIYDVVHFIDILFSFYMVDARLEPCVEGV
jgi:hypothetical protein